jgi:hypothetical protein
MHLWEIVTIRFYGVWELFVDYVIFGKSLGILWCFEILWGLCGFWGTTMKKHNEMTNLSCQLKGYLI